MGASLRSSVSYLALLAGLALGSARAAALPIEAVLYDFKGGASDGRNPQTALIIDKTGALYGTTGAGGSGTCATGGSTIGCGTAFRLAPPTAGKTGWSETALYSFPATDVPSGSTANPSALTYAGAADGEPYDGVSPLFGTATNGGAHGQGYVFALLPPANGRTAWIARTLYNFGSSHADGAFPQAGLLLDRTGALYGTTTSQGTGGGCSERISAHGGSARQNCGLVFKLTPPAKGMTRWTEAVIYRFNGVASGDGGVPAAALLMDKTGRLYGTTNIGGTDDECVSLSGPSSSIEFTFGCGTAFRLTPPANGATLWSETWVSSFSLGGFAVEPSEGASPSALTYLGAISGVPYNGVAPLYGTARNGGTGRPNVDGFAFELLPPALGGKQTALLSFGGGPDGGTPMAGVLVGRSGRLYGTTFSGGSIGNGVAFELTPPVKGNNQWTKTVLHNFGAAGDGASPAGGLIANGKGALLGTTSGGGTKGFGTVYQLTP
jgi:hypothetical protein